MADERRPTPPPPEAFGDPGDPLRKKNASSIPAEPDPVEGSGEARADAEGRERDRGVSDFFRRAVSAGFDAANRSKNDILRVATGEIRSWLDRMDLDRELIKALQKLTLEVKAEVRFRPNEEGQLVPEAKAETKVRGPDPRARGPRSGQE